MIFASYAGYSFNDFFAYAGRPSIFFAVQVGAIVGALFFFGYFRKHGKIKIDLPDEKIVSYLPAALLAAMIVGLALISFLSGSGLHYSSGFLCLALGVLGLAWFVLVRKEPFQKVKELVKGLDWDTIAFLIGVFIVIGAIGQAGLIADLAALLGSFIGGNVVLGFLVIVGASVLISGFVDNVPYIIAMLPVADSLAKGLSLKPELFMFALLIGSCLGGNLTPFGASANVVAMGLLRKEGRKTSFLDWVKIGLPFTALTTAAASLFVFLVWR
jgi:Na+/H+ antiporter NhaD/arsenite permease-like protein